MALWITAFFTGFLGSFHCMGMCGPIALALPDSGSGLAGKFLGRFLYNLGRIITYSFLGLLLGTFGLGLKLAGMQQSISIVAGILIILMVLFSTNFIERKLGNPLKWIGGKRIAQLFRSKSNLSLLFIGLLNGLLPCGFVYVGLAGSVATQDAFSGAIYMALFGFGTLPMMFGVSMAGQFLSIQIRTRITKVVPYLAVLIGVLFILRGLNLGISYISPKVSDDKNIVKECCTPKGNNQQ
jgi:hypothetical protein